MDRKWPEFIERLQQDLKDEAATAEPTDALRFMMMREAMSGDPSFLQAMAGILFLDVAKGNELNTHERIFIADILHRVSKSQPAAVALCGKLKKGAPKKGLRAWEAAMAVLNAVRVGGATSIENAWEMAGDEINLDASTVKKYWIQWRPRLNEFWKEGRISSDGLMESVGFDVQLKELLKANAEK